jgi:hypothetical protein
MNFFECYADESFLKCFGFTAKQLSGGHSFSRSKVSSKLKKVNNSLGLIDEDPGSPKDEYLSQLLKLKPLYSDNNVIVISEPSQNNRLFVIKPNLESWSVRIAKELGIDLENPKYRLSMDPKKLHSILSQKDNERARSKLTDFISDASGHPSIVALKKFLKN